MARIKLASQQLSVWAVLALFGILLVGCVRGNEATAPPEETVSAETRSPSGTASPTKTAALEHALGLILPANATVIGYSEATESDKMFRVKLRVSQQAFEQWLKGFGVTPDDFEEEKRYQLGPSTGWWDPARATALPTAQIPLGNARFLNLGYETVAGKPLQVYLVWFEI